MNVLSVGMTWFPEQDANGLDRGYMEHTRHLPGAGVRVRGLVAGSPEVEGSSAGIVRPFASEKAPLVSRLRAARRVGREELASVRPDAVISHFALHSAPLVDLLDVPLIVHFHGPWAQESAVEGASAIATRAKHWIEKYVYRRASRFVVLSEAFRSVLVNGYGIDESRVRIVPGGVDIEEYETGLTRAEARERLGWPADRRIILCVRRLMRRMGVEGLIDAVDAVRHKHPDVLLLIAGRGPISEELVARIERLGLSDHARLLGFVPEDDLPIAYAAADFSVMPTVALEGFGLPTVESLASGTPVLVTPQGGLPEVVRALDPRLVCDDITPAALGSRMGEVLDGTFVLPSDEECRRYAREGFSWESVARRLAVVYHEAVA